LKATREGQDWIFVSDAHFTGRDRGEMESFVRFVDEEASRMNRLVILGDFFEFLFGFRGNGKEAFPFCDYLPVLERLQTLYRQGIHITYFEGNHDFRLAHFFQEHFGMEIEVHTEGSEERLGEKRAFVAHGDLSNPGQRSYRILRGALKNRWTYGFIQWTGPWLARRVARKMSDMSYQRSHERSADHSLPVFRAFAHQKFTEGYEIVILGHSHFPEHVEEWVNGKKCLYFNVGDWAVRRSFLRFTPPHRFQLGRFESEN
jgi:UDP-2,3-diacylglucosamine hydrolase